MNLVNEMRSALQTAAAEIPAAIALTNRVGSVMQSCWPYVATATGGGALAMGARLHKALQPKYQPFYE